MKTLNTLKQLQKPKLHCSPGSRCWCAQIDFIFDEPQNGDCCLSPQEILDIAGDELTLRDQQYLETLLDKDFIKER